MTQSGCKCIVKQYSQLPETMTQGPTSHITVHLSSFTDPSCISTFAYQASRFAHMNQLDAMYSLYKSL